MSATKPRECTPPAGAAAATTSDASAPELPREFAPNVYLLSAGAGPLRANVYFVRSGASWVLVDTGVKGCAPQIGAAAETLFGAGSRPAAILITHSHPDHVGSAAQLARTWGCPVYLHPDELPMVSGDVATFRANTFPLDRRLILPLLRLGGKRCIEAIASRDGLRESARALDVGARGSVPGLPGWEVVPTPGHTVGHVAFFRPEDRVLLSGDAVVTKPGPFASLMGRKAALTLSPWYFTWNRAAAQHAASKLAELKPLVVAGGHGQPFSGADLSGQLRKLAGGS